MTFRRAIGNPTARQQEEQDKTRKQRHPNFSFDRVQVGAATECWPWRGGVNTWGYGCCVWNGKQSNASRAAYEFVNGKTPDGLVICHSCDNPICCNPSHLRADTQAANLAECRARGRQVYRRGEDHHRSNAKLTPELVAEARNLYASGISQTEIGRRWGIHSSVISRAVRGKNWKHVA